MGVIATAFEGIWEISKNVFPSLLIIRLYLIKKEIFKIKLEAYLRGDTLYIGFINI